MPESVCDNLPLIMRYTPRTRVEEAAEEEPSVYNDRLQILRIEMRIVGTKSLKIHSTKNERGVWKTDKANEIDDQKHVS